MPALSACPGGTPCARRAALQIVRRWTKANHDATHQATVEAARAEAGERSWSEHDFVLERDGPFLHGMGATPAWDGYAADATGLRLVPLDMAGRCWSCGAATTCAPGFPPHGAGRSVSPSERLGAPLVLQAGKRGLRPRRGRGRRRSLRLPHGGRPPRALADEGAQEAPDPRSCEAGGSSAAGTMSLAVAAGASKWWAMEFA